MYELGFSSHRDQVLNIKIEVDKKFLPKKFNLATAYAAGIANNSVTITVPIETAELIRIYLPKL